MSNNPRVWNYQDFNIYRRVFKDNAFVEEILHPAGALPLSFEQSGNSQSCEFTELLSVPQTVESGQRIAFTYYFPKVSVEVDGGYTLDHYDIILDGNDTLTSSCWVHNQFYPSTGKAVSGLWMAITSPLVDEEADIEVLYENGIPVGMTGSGVLRVPMDKFKFRVYVTFTNGKSDYTFRAEFTRDNPIILTVGNPVPVPQLNPAALMQGFATMLSLRK